MGLYEIKGPVKIAGVTFWEIGENTKISLKDMLSKKAYNKVILFLQHECKTKQCIVDFIFDLGTKSIDNKGYTHNLNVPTIEKMIKDYKDRIAPTIPDYEDDPEDFRLTPETNRR